MALGIALFSYNRPEYLDRVLASLVSNKGFDVNQLHIYQDYASDESHRACHAIIAKYGLEPRTTQRKYNYGIARNQYTAYQIMFNQYEDVLFLEDDMVLASNYLQTIKKMLKQFMKDDKCWFVKGGAKPAIGRASDVVTSKNPHQWGHAFNRERWLKIREYYDDIYQEYFEECEYGKRDVSKLKKHIAPYAAGQDGAKRYCAGLAGYEYSIETLLPRAKYIGVHGVHFTPEVYKRHGYSENIEIEHTLTKFVVVS
jgi:glycosyltransferase involved in cell wall biosynthesis